MCVICKAIFEHFPLESHRNQIQRWKIEIFAVDSTIVGESIFHYQDFRSTDNING